MSTINNCIQLIQKINFRARADARKRVTLFIDCSILLSNPTRYLSVVLISEKTSIGLLVWSLLLSCSNLEKNALMFCKNIRAEITFTYISLYYMISKTVSKTIQLNTFLQHFDLGNKKRIMSGRSWFWDYLLKLSAPKML